MLQYDTQKLTRAVALAIASLFFILPTQARAAECTFPNGANNTAGVSYTNLGQAITQLINTPTTTRQGSFGQTVTSGGYLSPYQSTSNTYNNCLATDQGATQGIAAAATCSSPTNVAPLPLQLINYGFSSSDPELSQNTWVIYMFASDSDDLPAFQCALQSVPDSLTLQNYASMIYFGTKYTNLPLSSTITNIDPDTGFVPPAPITSVAQAISAAQSPAYSVSQISQTLVNLQAFLNSATKWAPGLVQLLQAKQWSQAFQYASQHKLMRFVDMGVGFQVLGLQPLSAADMNAYYAAAQQNWSLFFPGATEPYYPSLDWSTSCPVTGAEANTASSSAHGYPDIARFCAHTPPVNFMDKWVAPIFEGALISVISAGFASGLVAAIASTTTSVAASGAVVSTTSIGGTTLSTSVAAAGVTTTTTTLASAAVNIGTSALASASVSTAAQGGSFGQNLISSLEGASLGAAISMSSVPKDVSSSMTNAGLNQTASNFITSLATGTVSGLVLNGGNFNQAFTSAVTSSVSNSLAQGVNQPSSVASNTSYSFDPSSTQSTGGMSMNGSNFSNPFQSANLQPLTIAQLNQSAGAVDLSNIPMPVVNIPTYESAVSAAAYTGGTGSFGSYSGYGQMANSVAQANVAFANEVNGATGVTQTNEAIEGAGEQIVAEGLSEDMTTVYHGSPVNGLTELVPQGVGASRQGTAQEILSDLGLSDQAAAAQATVDAEAGKVFVTTDYNLALNYAAGNGTVYSATIPSSSLYPASDLPDTGNGLTRSPLEFYVNGNLPVTAANEPFATGETIPSNYDPLSDTFTVPTEATTGAEAALSGSSLSSFADGLSTVGNFGRVALPMALDTANVVGAGITAYQVTSWANDVTAAQGYQNLPSAYGQLSFDLLNPGQTNNYLSTVAGDYLNVYTATGNTVVASGTAIANGVNNAVNMPVNVSSNIESIQQNINASYGGATNPTSASVLQANLNGYVVSPSGAWLTPQEAANQGYQPTPTGAAPAPSLVSSIGSDIENAVTGAYNTVVNEFSSGSTSAASTAPAPVLAPVSTPAPTNHGIIGGSFRGIKPN